MFYPKNASKTRTVYLLTITHTLKQTWRNAYLI